MNFELDKNLPESWEIVTIGEITLPYETEQPAKKPKTEFKYIDIGSIDNSTQTITNIKTFLGKDAPSRARRIVRKDDILFSTVRTYLKNIARVPIELDGVLTSTGIAVLRCTSEIDSNFLFYSVVSDKFIRKISSTMDGTLYPAVTDTDVMSAAIVIPPLNEQRRIVAKIEALKARSQRVKDAIAQIPQLLSQFRQSVLAAAFRGDLTADWREQNPDVEPASALLERIRVERRQKWEELELEKMKASGKTPKDDKWKEKYQETEQIDTSNLPELPEGWAWANMHEIADIDLGKMLDRGKEKRGEFLPYLRNINVRWGYFDLSDLLEMDFVKDEIERFNLKKDDILVCEGGEPGRSAVWELNESDIKYQKTLHRVRPFLQIPPFWFVYHLKLDAITGSLENYFSGSTIKHFTKASFQRYAVRLAGIEEQKEIILQIESLFKVADIIQQQYQEIKANVDQLDQSILAKAFRGELVPQNPEDEPASMLLDRIRAEREKLQTKTAKKSPSKTSKQSTKKIQDSPNEWLSPSQPQESTQLELDLE